MLSENTIFLHSYIIMCLCTHWFGCTTCVWKRIFILRSGNMMNWCSPSFFRSCTFERTLMQCWRYEETAEHKWTLCDPQCEWLHLNKLHICFCRLECQTSLLKLTQGANCHLTLPLKLWFSYFKVNPFKVRFNFVLPLFCHFPALRTAACVCVCGVDSSHINWHSILVLSPRVSVNDPP